MSTELKFAASVNEPSLHHSVIFQNSFATHNQTKRHKTDLFLLSDSHKV